MFSPLNNKQRKILSLILVAFVVVNVFGLIIVLPTPAYAQWVVTDPVTGANTTIRNITDFIRVFLIGVLGTALLNGLWYFSQRLAYDTAVWVASGGKGQGALVFQDGFGDYLGNVALDAVGEVIGSLDTGNLGLDLCRPPDLSSLLRIQLGIARRFQPPTPRCSWNDLSQNWDAFVSSASSGEILEGLGNMFQPGQSGLEVAFTMGARSHEWNLRRQLEATEDRREGDGFKPILDIISGQIVTPSQAVRVKAEEDLVKAESKQRELTNQQAASALSAGAFQLLPATLTIFANTLLSELTTKFFEGLFAPSPREERGPLFTLNPEASGRALSGRARAQAVFADLLTPKFVEVQNYDALTEFMTCPGINRGPNNCVIDAALASVIRISEAGVPLTVREALTQGALHADWRLIPSTDSKNQDANCYNEAYCYSNLAKLRRARIVPIGWELASEQGARLGITPTLEEVINKFYDCDPETGGASDTHPWCHLIDPNWVLKYPATQCRALVKGPTLLAAETSVRTDVCVDAASCIAKDAKGNCVSYGYCTREENIWEMPGESCPARYDSCQSYSKINSDGNPDKEVHLLSNTVEFDGCSAEVAGCSWYSNTRTPGVTTNLVADPSFEGANTADQWGGAVEADHSEDGTKSFDGRGAYKLGNIAQSIDTPAKPNTTYTVSFYAKQEAAAAVDHSVKAHLEFLNGAGDVIGDAAFPLDGRSDGVTLTTCDWQGDGVNLTFAPGTSYRRAECRFTTSADVANLTLRLTSLSPAGAPRHFVDAIQLEEAARATFFHVGAGREAGWQRDERIYYNRNVETCSENEDGCTDLILKGAGVSKNLLQNSSFEIDDDPGAFRINFWRGIGGDDPVTPDVHENYITDGSQSFEGQAAVRVGDRSGGDESPPLFLGGEVFLEPETTYTFSFYAKQSDAGAGIEATGDFGLRLPDGTYADMSGRTSCPLEDQDGDDTFESMVLSFVPGDAYSRLSCTFTTPPTDGSKPSFKINILGSEAWKIWVDAVQLEEGLVATEYRETGYPAQASHAYYKIPPDYLGCRGGPLDPPECANYTLMCTQEDTNCELYTPTDGSPAIPGIVTSDKLCPNECIGYSTFRQEETSFERAKYPLFFIAATGDMCEAQYAGCDEFTNLETTAVEHYSYLRQCIREGAESATYYTWEGSDTAGFQLKVWSFKRGVPLAGRDPAELGRPPEYRPGFIDFNACTRDIFRSGVNPDCREFYDTIGNISYRLYSELIVSTSECNRYRRTEPTQTVEECEESGGSWDDVSRNCTFLGYPAESRACPADKKGCRSYTGNAGRNVRVLNRVNFEGGELGGFTGTLSGESVYVGGHSLEVGGETEIAVGSGDARIRNGGTYLITFLAKGSGRPDIRFDGAGGRTEKYFSDASFELRSDWQRYTLGPVLVDWDVSNDEVLEFTGLGIPSFIDDFELREVQENIYLIKDSWVTPESCDQDSSGAPFPQAMLGCSEYRDRAGVSAALTGFDRLCSEAAVGCRAVIDTRNSTNLEEERFNLTCSLDQDEDGDSDDADACNDISCVCRAYVNGAERDVCAVSRGATSCRFNSVGPASAVDGVGSDYVVSVNPDSVIVSEDRTKYLILDEAKACKSTAAGCTLYGNPEEGTCSLGAVCASPDGRCNCAITGDVVCQVTAGEQNCNYKIPRYFLDGSGTNFGTIVLKNDPQKYSETLCTNEFLGCVEWSRGAAGAAYFKDPIDQQCEYKENVNVRGVTTNGWFKKGMEAEPCDPAFAVGGTEYNIRKNGDTQYRGWAGICEKEFAGCTAFLDAAASSDIYPEGRPYYLIKDKQLEEGNDCSGRVSQKEGCALFKDTSVPSNQYSSDASYATSEHNNYGMVPVSSCPGGAGCKRCVHNFEYAGLFEVDLCTEAGGARLIGGGGGLGGEACQLDVYGATCVEDGDCERDIVESPPGGNLKSSRCVTPPESAPVINDSNVILKVTRDRQCSEWLDCKTQVSVWDDQAKKFKKVCTQLGRCDSYVTTGDGVKCANYKKAEYSGDVLSLSTYVSRDVSWYGDEYSGFSIPQHYPVDELAPVDYDKTANQDIRLAYVACEQGAVDRNCDLRDGALPGACRRSGFACGEPNSLGNRGTCVSSGGAGASLTCVYGIDGSSVPAQGAPIARLIGFRPPSLDRALPPEQCRAYPEQDSPFPYAVSKWSQAGLPLSRVSGFQSANVCERFAWTDRDGDGIRDTNPAWPDPRAELIPQNCECSYSKVIYNGKSFTKYYGIEEDKIPQGICQGGPRSGEPCTPGAVFSDKKPATDKENLRTCGPPTQSGICQKVERIDEVIGLPGQCLEQDLSLSLNGIPQNYACLTWNPLGIVPGGKDIYNQYADAGYSPTGSTGRYFCVEARGLGGNVNQSYETMYVRDLDRDLTIGANADGISDGGADGPFYREQFEYAADLVGASDIYMKDIAAIRFTITDPSGFADDRDEVVQDAINDAVGSELNVLSRIGKTGTTAGGREYWEVAFNLPSGQSLPRGFEHEGLVDGSETDNPFDDGSGCENSSPENIYTAIRAVFDNTPARKFLGLWTAYCDGSDNNDLRFNFDVEMLFAEPCNVIARVEGSNAAFTDRAWSGSGYLVGDEADIVDQENMFNSTYGNPPENDYEESFMLGYGYENRNTPFGSAASTQEPFGAEAWQVNGPDGFGSPYLRYIPTAPDAGSPYACSVRREGVDPENGAPVGASCGANLRCSGTPFSGQASLNEGKTCMDRTGCPLQKQCTGAGLVIDCATDADCAGRKCSASHCRTDAGVITVINCTTDADCGSGTCDEATAFAECTDQFRQFGKGPTKQCVLEADRGIVISGPCQADRNCPGGTVCQVPDGIGISSPRLSPLEFLFARSFGIWRWQPTEGETTIGLCVGGTPVDGQACTDDPECSQSGARCESQDVCDVGPWAGQNCNAGENQDCRGVSPLSSAEDPCPPKGLDFTRDGTERCEDGPNAGDLCRDATDCYTDVAVCDAGTSQCRGGAFDSATVYDPPCPAGWVEVGGRCRLPCGADSECRYGAAQCATRSQCDSGVLAGLACALDAQCNFAGTCNETTVTQPPGYQKIQSAPDEPSGWDNREEDTLGEQPTPPIIASPDISACDLQSQRCRVQGMALTTNNIDCSVAADCPSGWTCEARSRLVGASGDSSGSTCIPPRGLDTNALSINNRTLGDLRGAGSFRAILRFYAWADHNAMPIVSRSVDWGDGLLDKTVNSKYKNHKSICSAGDTDDSASKECQGVPGLTCAKQADCPAGTGLCVPVGKCSITRARCSVDDDCGLTTAGERCVLSRFGNAPSACDEQYFEFEHTYVCTRDLLNSLPACVGADLDPTNKNPEHVSCARDLNNDTRADACMFRPKVQVRDNWGYCNGLCPTAGLGGGGSPGGLRCYENECDVHPGAWTGFGGFITLTPRS